MNAPDGAASPVATEASVDLSLVVVQFGGVELLRACLASLPAACSTISHEVIVVDNASPDDSVAMVRREFPHVRMIANATNAGFTRANNQGIAIARGRHVCLLNNDTEAHAGAFDAAVAYLDANADIGALGLRLLNTDGTRQASCRRFPGLLQSLFNRTSLMTRLFPNNPFSTGYLMTDLDDDAPHDVDWVSGACLLVRREVLAKIGGLDERFFMYSEDVDFCLRVWRGGWRVTFYQGGVVTHHSGASSNRMPYYPIVARHRSMWVFYKKHYSRELLFLDAAVLGMIGLRCATQLAGVALRRAMVRPAAATDATPTPAREQRP